jgi:site-specific recombinase XerC
MSASSRSGTEPVERASSSCALVAELSAIRDALAGGLVPESRPRVLGLVDRFGVFVARAFEVQSLGAVTSLQVDAFVRSSTAGGELPSIATMRLRRSVLRSLFRAGRELGLVTGDPTLDVLLPSRTNRAARALTDLEVQRCRRAALEDLTSTRLSVPWALGEATARTAEIPTLRVADVDLDRRRVWISGSSNTEARWGALTSWGVGQLERHLKALGPVEETTLLTARRSNNAESRRAHSSQTIRETLRRTGLTDDESVRPASLTAWAGNHVLGDTGRIDLVARALGIRSLDGAARLIGWDWATAASGVDG